MTATARYIYWEEDGAWLGYLDEFPDYLTQGETRANLEEHLRALYADLTSGELETHMDVRRRHIGELQLA